MAEKSSNKKYGWFSTTTEKLSSMYNILSRTLSENLTFENDSEEYNFVEFREEIINNETESSVELNLNDDTHDEKFYSMDEEYKNEYEVLVDIPLNIEEKTVEANSTEDSLNTTKNEEETLNNEEKYNDNDNTTIISAYVQNDVLTINESYLVESDISKNERNSDKNNNLGNDLDNNGNSSKYAMTMDNDDDDSHESKNVETENDYDIYSGHNNNYPDTILCSEEDDRSNKLQQKINKHISKQLVQSINNKSIRKLSTIDKNKDYQTVETTEDNSDFELVISKKNKKRNKQKRKGYVSAEAIGNCVREAVDASIRERKQETLLSNGISDKKEISYNNSDKTKNNIYKSKFTVQNLNSYTPLDPSYNIKPDHYKQVINARRELSNNIQVTTTGTNNNNSLSTNNKQETATNNTKGNYNTNSGKLNIQLNKLSLREYLLSHRDIGLNKNMPFLTTKSKQLPLMKQLIENERAKGNNINLNNVDGKNEWNQIGDKKAVNRNWKFGCQETFRELQELSIILLLNIQIKYYR
jgi:hypothetical protein